MSGLMTVERIRGCSLFKALARKLQQGNRRVQVLGGRYGLSSKDTTPAQMIAVYDNMAGEQKDHFTG